MTLVSDEPAPNRRRLGDDAAGIIGGWLREEGVELHARRRGAPDRARRRCGLRSSPTRPGPAARSWSWPPAWRRAASWPTGAGIALERRRDPGRRRRCAPPRRTCSPRATCAWPRTLAAGRPLAVEHWGDALGQGEIAGRTAAGKSRAVVRCARASGRRSAGARSKYAAWGDGYDTAASSATTTVASPSGTAGTARLVGVLTHDADEDYERGGAMIARGSAVELVSVVVVPARDEEQQIGGCLEALARADRASGRLRDDRRTRRLPRRHRGSRRETAAALGLPVQLLEGPGTGAGGARRAGMDAAADLLDRLGLPRRADRLHRRRLAARAGLAGAPARASARRRARGRRPDRARPRGVRPAARRGAAPPRS